MSTAYEVPLIAAPETFFISLAGITYRFTTHWCPYASAWILDIASEAGDLIIGGIAIVTGVDLLDQYEYLAFGGRLEAQSDFDLTAVPTFDNLGSGGRLYFIVE